MVLPGAAAGSSLALNGHRVNPLKVNPPAAVAGAGGRCGGKKKEKETERRTGSEKQECSDGVIERGELQGYRKSIVEAFVDHVLVRGEGQDDQPCNLHHKKETKEKVKKLFFPHTSASIKRIGGSPLDGLRDGRLALQDRPPAVKKVSGWRLHVRRFHRHADAAQEALPLYRLQGCKMKGQRSQLSI